MEKLKVKEVKNFEVDYDDLESLIENVYGGGYCFMADVECSNDSVTAIGVTQDDIDDIDEDDVQSIRDGNVSDVRIYSILPLLVKDGHAELGDYLINISY